MGLLDDLEKMMMLQQMNGQQQNQGYGTLSQGQQGMEPQMPNMNQGSPLEKGSMMAVQSARDSIAAKKRMLAMDDTENQRALGRAILAMQHSMNNNPNFGTGTMANISAMSEGAANGMLQYDQERERIANANNVLLNQQKEEERLARQEELQMKKMSHAMEMDRKRLGIEQASFGLKKQEREEALKEIDILSKPGGEVPMGALSTSGWNYAQKYLDKNREELNSSRKGINSIDEAYDVIERNPNIMKHWSVILSAAQKHDPTIVKQKLLNTVDEKTLNDASLLSKNLMKIYTSEVGTITPRALNQKLEQRILEASPTMDMRSGALKHILDDLRNDFVSEYKNKYETEDAFQNRGTFKRSKPTLLDYDPEKTTKYGNKNSSENKASLSQLTPEQAEARKAQIREQLAQ